MLLPTLMRMVLRVWEMTLYGPWYFGWSGGLTASTLTYTHLRSGTGLEGEVTVRGRNGRPVFIWRKASRRSWPVYSGELMMDPGKVQLVPYII